MKRRIVLITCLLGLVGGGAGAALASPSHVQNHDICIGLAQNEQYNHATYYCIVTP